MNRQMSGFISTLLQRISIERLVSEDKKYKIYYDELDENMVKDLMLTYYPSMGDATVDGIIEEIRLQFEASPMELIYPDQADKLNIFLMVFYYVRDILTFRENEVSCQYSRLLEWNELTRIIGKDLPITAFLVYEDWENGLVRKNFFWPPVIGHDNGQLNKVLSKGLAENHFHLRGSTPYFDISWINLMNHPTKPQYLEELDLIENNLRDKKRKPQFGLMRHSFKDMIRVAALIRIFLSERLTGKSIKNMFAEGFLSFNEICNEDVEASKVLSMLEGVLAYPDSLELKSVKLQTEIDLVQWCNGKLFPDYLLHNVSLPVYSKDTEYWLLSGERWFLYHMLKNILSRNETFYRDEYNMFFTYIRIKNELRGELIQNNDVYGFDNFQIYQNRKDSFSHEGDWIQAEGALARLAVRDVLSNPAVKHLELRINPRETAEDIMQDIKGYDYFILKNNIEGETIEKQLKHMKDGIRPYETEYDEAQLLMQKRFHYVFHFIKKKDTAKGFVSKYECRHYEYRDELLRRTAEIILFRQRYPKYADRLVGIDACSREIGCRPEVFGRAFRTLRFYIPPEPKTAFIQDHPINQLRFTYHVGEDFLDITDGLRAIDEAIRFLAMDSGDRLGHAMALGVNAIQWYAARSNRVTLPIQDYIDNIVWMHHNLIHYCIEDFSSLKGWLEEKYSQYFDYVYQPFVLNWSEKKEESFKEEEYYADMAQNGFDINTYYLSWLLRGDKPEMYKSGRFKRSLLTDQWKELAINAQYIKRQDIRNIPQVTLLYSMYHYNEPVRKRGSEVRTFRLHPDYAKAVLRIQKKMQVMIDKKGIAIETNPSSNYKISSLGSFVDHPIKDFYNMGLEMDQAKLYQCPQMNVSINTDDEGVFSTRLENEYALLARALEEAVDENGEPMYKRQNIYQWLDNIREMGLHQSFYNISEV